MLNSDPKSTMHEGLRLGEQEGARLEVEEGGVT